jgi:ammonia channel protein AmtB
VQKAVVNTGDMAFIMVCVSLVQLMTIPGLALFYGGLSQTPNVLAAVMQSFSITCLVTILWLICGYSIAFDRGVNSNPVVGGSGMIWFNSTAIMNAEIGTIPLSLYVTYQGTFAVITAAIITGSVAERMRFGPMLIFLGIWHLLVYCPLCHWEWGGGTQFNCFTGKKVQILTPKKASCPSGVCLTLPAVMSSTSALVCVCVCVCERERERERERELCVCVCVCV